MSLVNQRASERQGDDQPVVLVSFDKDGANLKKDCVALIREHGWRPLDLSLYAGDIPARPRRHRPAGGFTTTHFGTYVGRSTRAAPAPFVDAFVTPGPARALPISPARRSRKPAKAPNDVRTRLPQAKSRWSLG